MYKLKSLTHSKGAVSQLQSSVRLPYLGKEWRLWLSVYCVVGLLGSNAESDSDRCALNV